MKFIKTLLVLFSLSANAGLPPTSLIGRDSAEKNGFYPLSVPNAQSTRITGGALIETGNENILANPSFESNRSTTGYGWSVSGATVSLDTTNQIHGKNALSLSLSSTLNLNQSAATNVANTVGLQAVASVYIKSSLADVNVCSIINNVEDKCVQYNGTNTWVKIEIPFIFGATQNGIKIKTTSSTSGTVLVDNAFVGLSSPFQNVNGAKLMGTLTIAGTASCSFTTSSTTYVGYTANASCPSSTTTGVIQAAGTKIPAFVLPAGSPAGTYKIVATGPFIKAGSVADYVYFRLHDGTNPAIGNGFAYTQTVGGGNGTVEGAFTYTSNLTSSTTIQLQGATASASNQALIDNVQTNSAITFMVYYFPPDSKIYSTASQDTDWQPCTFSTLAWQGLGTVTNNLICKRSMGDLLIKGSFTTGTVAASTVQIPLPTNFGTITTSSLLLSNTLVGLTARGYASAPTASLIYGLIAQPSQTYLNVSNNGNAQYDVPVNGSAVFASSEKEYISELRIPINEWKNYGVIVGSFQYVPQVPGQSNVDIFSLSYGTTNATTVCSASPCSYLSQTGNAISSITRSGTGSYSFNFSKTYLAINCSASLNASAGITGTQGLLSGYTWSCKNCNSLSVTTGIANYSAYDTYGTLFCTGSY